MAEFENLGDLIRRDRDMSKVAIVDLRGAESPCEYTYVELDAMASGVARALSKRGFNRGDRVAILAANRTEYIAAYFGIMRAGFVAVPVNYRFPRKTIHTILEDCGAKLVFCDDASKNDVPHGLPHVLFGSEDADGFDEFIDPGQFQSVMPSPGEPAMFLYTSGSTGRPKAVAVTPHNVALGIANQRYTLGEEFVALNRRLCCPGIDVTYGYRMLMRTLAEGGLYCFVDQNLARNVRSLNFYRVQAVLGSPQQLAFLADYGEQNPGSFTTVEVLVSTGARLPPLLSEKLRRHVCPRLIASYGSSEGGYISAGLAETLDLERGEVGRVIPTVEAEIVDEATHEPVAQGSGLVRFRGEDFVRSYYGEAEGDDPHFEDGWFYPGDIATLSPDRMLTILGRNDNVVNLGGVEIVAALQFLQHTGQQVDGFHLVQASVFLALAS